MTRVNDTTPAWLSLDFRDLTRLELLLAKDLTRLESLFTKARTTGDESSLELLTLDLIRVFYQSVFTSVMSRQNPMNGL